MESREGGQGHTDVISSSGRQHQNQHHWWLCPDMKHVAFPNFRDNSFSCHRLSTLSPLPSLHFVFLVGLAALLVGVQFHRVWEETMFLETSTPRLSQDFSDTEKEIWLWAEPV